MTLSNQTSRDIFSSAVAVGDNSSKLSFGDADKSLILWSEILFFMTRRRVTSPKVLLQLSPFYHITYGTGVE